MSLNPKIPASRASNPSLTWSPRGLALNLANANTWTATQSFNGSVGFGSSVSFSSTVYNYSGFYNYGTFYNIGTFSASSFTCTGLITTNGGFLAQAVPGTYYEYNYDYNFTLDHSPVAPSTIGGNCSDGYNIYDDGLGYIYSYGYGQIAQINYNTGEITDMTGNVYYINYIYYTTTSVGNVSISPTGSMSISDGYNTITFGGGVAPGGSFQNSTMQVLLCTDNEAAGFYNSNSNEYTYLGTDDWGLLTDGGINVVGASTFDALVTSQTGFKAGLSGVNSYTENEYYGTFYLGNTPVIPGTITGTSNDGGTLSDDSNGNIYSTTATGSDSQSPYSGGYQLNNHPVVPSSISGSASDGGSLTDDGMGNIYSTLSGNYYSYSPPQYSYYNLYYSNVTEGSISGTATDSGNLSDSGGYIYSSNYGSTPIATIDYASGLVTDQTGGMVYMSYVMFYYSIVTNISSINYYTGVVTDVNYSIYTNSISYSYGGYTYIANIDYNNGYVSDGTSGGIYCEIINYEAGSAAPEVSEMYVDGGAYFYASAINILEINDGTYTLKVDGNQVFNTGYIVDNVGSSTISIDTNARILYDANGSPIADYSGVNNYGFQVTTLEVDNIFPSNNTSVSFGSGGDADIYFKDAYAGGNGGGMLSFSAATRTLNDSNGGAVLNWSNTIGLIGGSSPTGIIDLNLGVLKTYITSTDVTCLDFYNRTLNDSTGTAIVTWGDGTYALNVTGQNYFHDSINIWDMYFFNSAAIEGTVNGYGKTFTLGHGDYAGSFSDQSNNNVTLADGSTALYATDGTNVTNLCWDGMGLSVYGISCLGDGGDTNYTNFDGEGHQTMVGTAQPWEDLRIEPVARTSGTNAPTFEKWYDDAAGTSRGVYLYSFDNAVVASEKEVFFTMQMPHAWNGGDIQMHVHWVPAATENNTDVIWGLEYIWKDIGEVYGDTTLVTSSTTLVPDDANITAGKHYISKFTALTPGSTADGLSSILIGRLYRKSADGSDTYTNKVGLLYIDAHYQSNSLGSNDEYQK